MRRPFKYSSASICPLGCFISKGSNANNDNTHNNIDWVDLPCDWRAGRHRPDYWQRERRLYVVVVTVQEKCKNLYNQNFNVCLRCCSAFYRLQFWVQQSGESQLSVVRMKDNNLSILFSLQSSEFLGFLSFSIHVYNRLSLNHKLYSQN